VNGPSGACASLVGVAVPLSGLMSSSTSIIGTNLKEAFVRATQHCSVKNLPHMVFIFVPLDAEAWLRKKVEFKKNDRYFDT
jgi:hypothetical protein